MDRVGQVLVETYRLTRRLGQGGTADVYEAEHLRVPKRVAIKFLKPGLVTDSGALQRFRKEAEILAELSHPNVVGLSDYNIAADGAPYMVLELIEGISLAERLAQGRVPVGQVGRIVRAIGSALEVAHTRGIIHRDLKPENVLLVEGRTDSIKVVDFGVAKTAVGPQVTAANMVVGTVTYMAPEQIAASSVDARVDQFALGVMAYEMLSGQLPFGASESMLEQARRMMTQEVHAIPGISQAVMQVLRRALSRGPDSRFARVQDFVEALEVALRSSFDDDAVTMRNLWVADVAAAPEVVAAEQGPTRQMDLVEGADLGATRPTPALGLARLAEFWRRRMNGARTVVIAVGMGLALGAITVLWRRC